MKDSRVSMMKFEKIVAESYHFLTQRNKIKKVHNYFPKISI